MNQIQLSPEQDLVYASLRDEINGDKISQSMIIAAESAMGLELITEDTNINMFTKYPSKTNVGLIKTELNKYDFHRHSVEEADIKQTDKMLRITYILKRIRDRISEGKRCPMYLKYIEDMLSRIFSTVQIEYYIENMDREMATPVFKQLGDADIVAVGRQMGIHPYGAGNELAVKLNTNLVNSHNAVMAGLSNVQGIAILTLLNSSTLVDYKPHDISGVTGKTLFDIILNPDTIVSNIDSIIAEIQQDIRELNIDRYKRVDRVKYDRVQTILRDSVFRTYISTLYDVG